MVVGSNPTGPTMNLSQLLADTAAAVRLSLNPDSNWTLTGSRTGQYHADVATNEAALDVLLAAGAGVLSEETGWHAPSGAGPAGELTVVLDPVDGSTNASLGLPWYSISLCALAGAEPVAAHVENLVSGVAYTAQAGQGAFVSTRTGAPPQPISPSSVKTLAQAILGVSGYPPQHWGWQQLRSLGSSALDLCQVAAGSLDAFADATPGELAPWDYLGGMFICQQAGACVAEANGEELVALEPTARRKPVAAATPELLAALLESIAG